MVNPGRPKAHLMLAAMLFWRQRPIVHRTGRFLCAHMVWRENMRWSGGESGLLFLQVDTTVFKFRFDSLKEYVTEHWCL